MTARLDTVVTEARAALSAAEQDRLAEIISAYVATRSGDPNDLMSDAQRAELARRHRSEFEPATDAEVSEFFVKHGA